MVNVDVKSIAGEAEKVVEAIVKVEPFISTMAMFVPGAAPVMAVIHPAVVALAPLLEKALLDMTKGNNGDAFAAFIQMAMHISKGFPNSPLLAAPSQDPSAQGSGVISPQP